MIGMGEMLSLVDSNLVSQTLGAGLDFNLWGITGGYVGKLFLHLTAVFVFLRICHSLVGVKVTLNYIIHLSVP